ncbi:hypothetical protein V8D89_009749 [Ganoderma adspersum]
MSLKTSRALLNQDVVYAILEHLAIPDALWYDYDTATRSTKAFLFPAMSVLWRDIGSLETLGFLAPRRISRKVGAAVPWLPTYAEYSHWDVPGTMDLLPLLSPALRSLHILFRNLSNATRYKRQAFVEALLLQAAQTAPNLTYLRITRASGIPEAWLHPVDQFSGLKILDISEPAYDEVTTCDLLPGLAAMNSLRSLKLRLPTPLVHNAPNPVARSFDALQDVDLDCKHASLDDAITFLRAVSSPYLESVRLEGCECPTNSLAVSLLELCTVIRDRFASTIRAVSLSVTPIGAPTVFEHSLNKYLEPLLHVRELAEFRFSISRSSKNVSMRVPDSDLVAMASSWPRLSRLDLNYIPADEMLTVQALLSLAQHCPCLTTLNLPSIDARDVAFVPSSPPHPFLISFGVFDDGWDSLIPEPRFLAKFLKTLFPRLVLERPQLEAEQWSRTAESFERL